MQLIEFEGLTNVRDLGGTPVAGGRMVKPGLFIRGDALCKATDADLEKLQQMGLACVVDLRCGWELEAKPDRPVPGAAYQHIPFYDKEKVGIEYEQPAPGTEMQGRDLVCEPSHYYWAIANPLTSAQMGKALDAVFAYAARGEMTFQHCSGGKDRTGILALLILTVLGASREAVLEDYLMTNVGRDKNLGPIIERFTRLTGSEEEGRKVAYGHRANPENLDAFYASVDERYGSMETFLTERLGFGPERREELRELCTSAAV